MQGSRKLTLGLSGLLAALAIFDFAIGAPGARLNADAGAVHAAAAVLGFVCFGLGARACNVYLVGAGLLFCTDAFMGVSRGLFYLSFEAMRGNVEPLGKPARYLASAPSALIGVVALVAGLRFANADARRDRRPPPV
ncbi:MAG: hypothetical protein KGM42_04565 [Hyphomicrobiales bacterium]|nr:hypothetical protein [Hyphomicrobiales bacterium]